MIKEEIDTKFEELTIQFYENKKYLTSIYVSVSKSARYLLIDVSDRAYDISKHSIKIKNGVELERALTLCLEKNQTASISFGVNDKCALITKSQNSEMLLGAAAIYKSKSDENLYLLFDECDVEIVNE